MGKRLSMDSDDTMCVGGSREGAPKGKVHVPPKVPLKVCMYLPTYQVQYLALPPMACEARASRSCRVAGILAACAS